jgi:hypothetical protein
MESSAGAAAEKDRIRVTARKPATTPPASKRLRNVDTKMCAANDDMRTFLHVTRNLLSFARSQASGTDHELALSLLWRPAMSLGTGASAAPGPHNAAPVDKPVLGSRLVDHFSLHGALEPRSQIVKD